MNIVEIISLFGIMALLAAVPGAGVALVVTRTATLGVANGIAVSVGIILGDLVFILLAILGLSLVAETMGSLFIVIKYLGAASLLWLGFRLLSSNTTTLSLDKKIDKRSLATGFLAGFLLTLGDIKAIVFYASLLPVFLDLSALNMSDIMIFISVMVLSVGGVKLLYVFFASKIASSASSHKLEGAARKTAGGLMLGTGSYLILKA